MTEITPFTDKEKLHIAKQLMGMQPSSIIVSTKGSFVAVDIEAYRLDKAGIQRAIDDLNIKYGFKQEFQTPTHFVYKIINRV